MYKYCINNMHAYSVYIYIINRIQSNQSGMIPDCVSCVCCHKLLFLSFVFPLLLCSDHVSLLLCSPVCCHGHTFDHTHLLISFHGNSLVHCLCSAFGYRAWPTMDCSVLYTEGREPSVCRDFHARASSQHGHLDRASSRHKCHGKIFSLHGCHTSVLGRHEHRTWRHPGISRASEADLQFGGATANFSKSGWHPKAWTLKPVTCSAVSLRGCTSIFSAPCYGSVHFVCLGYTHTLTRLSSRQWYQLQNLLKYTSQLQSPL